MLRLITVLFAYTIAILVSCVAQNEGQKPLDLAKPEPVEANYSQALKAEFLKIAEELTASNNPHHGTAQISDLGQRLKDPATPKNLLLGIHAQLGVEHLRLGKIDKASGHVDQAFKIIADLGGEPAEIMLKLRALVELRRAEVSNCIQRHHRECCIFPLAGGGVHEDKAATQAVNESLRQILALNPDRPVAPQHHRDGDGNLPGWNS